MSGVSWIKHDVLEMAEAALPKLLQGKHKWGSLVTEGPGEKVERLHRRFNDYDLFLLRLTRPVRAADVFNVGPLEEAIVGRVVEGRMSIGICQPDETDEMPLHLAACSLGPSSWYAYRSGNRLSWRLDSPLSLHVVVCKKPALLDPNPATPETIAEILGQFRKYYPTESILKQQREKVGYGHRSYGQRH